MKGKDYGTIDFLNWNVELIEEQQDIEIQAIEEYKTEYAEDGADFDLRNYINKKILPAIKQLDRNINKE